MIIKTETLKKSLSTIMPGIESGRVTIEGADLVIFLDGKMLSYNGKVAVSIPMQLDSYGFGVKAKDLFNLVGKLKEETLDITADTATNKMKVSSGRFKATLIMQDITNISKFLSKLNFENELPLPANFNDAVKTVQIPDNRTPLKGFGIGKVGNDTYLISTDKVRISAYKLAGEMQQCLLNDDLVNDAVLFGTPKTYSITGPWFHFGYENGMHFSMIRDDDTAFKFESIGAAMMRSLERESVASFTFPDSIGEVSDRVTTMGSADSNSKIQCKLTIESDKLTVSAEKTTGSAEESINWSTPATISEPVSVWLPVKTLVNIAGKATGCKVVQFQSQDGKKTYQALVIHNDSYSMVASCSR